MEPHSTDPSLSEIWPFPLHSHYHFPPQINNNTSTKRNHSLSDNECSTKQLGIGGGGSSDDDAFKPQTDSTSSDEAPPKQQQQQQDYIHVKARRGQATDSHSLAERARREKISERIKILQDLVPGCNKVNGKALVLDEIINYIQSMQRQVEFLSMKLEVVNSTLNMHPSIDCFSSKDHVNAQPFDLSGIIFGSQSSRGYAKGSQPGWIHMQIAGGFDKAT